MNRSRALLLGLAFVVLSTGLVGCRESGKHSGAESESLSTLPVRTKRVQSEERTLTEEVMGTIQPKLRATLEAKVSGRIDRLPVVVGQRIREGELVARIEAVEIQARVEQAEAGLEQAVRDLKRVSTLFEQKAMTQSELDAVKTRERVARGGVAEARAMLSYMEVKAPFDAVVTAKRVDVGDLAMPGKPLVDVEAPSMLRLEADVPQSLVGRLKLGMRLMGQVDGVGGEVAGAVVEVGPTADPVTRTVRVKVDLETREGLASGQFARLRVPVGERRVVRVPAVAVVERGQMDVMFSVVQGKARLLLVRPGRRVGDEVEILSGLRDGDVIVVEPASRLVDGQPVEAR